MSCCALLAVLVTAGVTACDQPAPSTSDRPSPDSPQPDSPQQVLELRTPDGPRRLEVYFSEDRTRGFFVVGHAEQGWTSHVYPIWTAHVADVDADGTDEVLAGIWSNKRRHDEPQPHRTVWVFGLRDGELFEQWRGSALARPLVDFDVERSEGGDLLVAIERDGAKCVRTQYEWNGFGFTGLDVEGQKRRPVDCKDL